MDNCRFFNKTSFYIVFNDEMRVEYAMNFDNKLLFDINPSLGKSISEIVEKESSDQASVLVEGLNRAWREKRNSCFEYISTHSNGEKTYVAAQVEYNGKEGLCLYLSDLNTNYDEQNSSDLCLCSNDKSLFKEINIGIIIFDKEGLLLDANPAALKFGRENTILELNLFDNPNINQSIKNRLLAGENITGGSYASRDNRHIEISVTVVRKADGAIDRYVVVLIDITERARLQDKILNNIPIPIHIKDVENDFSYLFCNNESMRMFGSSVDKTIYDIMEAEEVERIQKTDFETYSTGKPYTGFERIVLKDGRTYDTIVRKSIINDGGKSLLLTSRWDQGLQNDLMRRSKLLTLTMEAMNAYTWFFEPANNRISFGDGFSKVGVKSTDVNTLEKFIQCIHPEDRDLFNDSLEKIVKNEGGIWDVESRIDLNGEGIYKWWQTRGMFEETTINDAPYKYMFGMTICVDEYKQTELNLIQNKEELKEWVSRNELILNNTNSGFAYISTDYVVKWENISTCSSNLAFEAYKQGEMCYKSAHNRTSPCDNCVMQRAMKSRQTESIIFNLDNNNNVNVSATPVFNDDDGSISGIVIRVDDVTEREQMITELREAKLQAEQSDKLKSAFLANMSHEIRTPLNAIVGFSEMLINCSEEDKEEYMQIISMNNELLLKLINDILDLSKIEAGSIELKSEEFDLANYFEDLSSSMKLRVTNPNVRLISINPYSKCNVFLDCNRLAQILTNYVTNAIKYTPKGFIEMGYEHRDNSLYLYVKDSGIGISDYKKDKVFHRFEKLDDFAQGTGLGLSICKAIAESMGGSVGFESQIGEGSTFWVELPCKSVRDRAVLAINNDMKIDNNILVIENEFTNEVAQDQRKVILVAEDILSNFQLLSVMLKKQFDLIHAVNGLAAIEVLQKQHVDLIFMDMKMPIMDGVTATAKIREFNTQLPIIALTAHAFESDRSKALEAGCNDYLVKPVNKAQIMTALRKYNIT